MYARTVTVMNPSGLHARPAALLAKEAARHAPALRIRNATKEGDAVDAKSMIAVMLCNVSAGDVVELCADGPGEREAVDALAGLIESGCGE